MMRLLLSLLLLPLFGPADAADVYRWVDSRGNVHYGEVVPEQYRSRSRRINTADEPTPEQRRQAQERVLRDRQAAQRMADSRTQNAASQPAMLVQKRATQAANPNATPCEREWRRFAESSECFAPYMLAGGGIKPEAFQKCVEVKAPSCGPAPEGLAR